jgi:DNA-directed RNA polymerase specialized sigma24 family protein
VTRIRRWCAPRGDPMALGELMEILGPYVGRICGPIALQDGPDATQEALISILRGIRGLKEPAALFGWVRVIAVREAVRVARRTARPSAVPVEEVSAASDPELAVDVADTLTRLTPEHRAVLMLRYVEGRVATSHGDDSKGLRLMARAGHDYGVCSAP